MRTDDLIRAISHDIDMRTPWLPGRMTLAILTGGAVAWLLFANVLAVRPDIVSALHTWSFVLKVAVMVTLLAFTVWACLRLVQPQTNFRDVYLGLAVAPAMLALGATYELMTVPPSEWLARAVGTNSRICLIAIPLLSIASLVAMLAALRAGAPRSPSTAGAAAGLLAGALAAVLYATHCPDDSPLFVAVWYSLAIALVVLVGAVAGHRVLRW